MLDVIAGDSGRYLAVVLLGAAEMLTLVPAFLAAARLAQRRPPVYSPIGQ